MICENPMTKSDEYLLHCRHPRILIRVSDFTGMSIEERDTLLQDVPVYGACEVFGHLYYLIPIEQYTNFFGEKPEKLNVDLSKLMRRCAEWWKAYIIWEDKNS